MNNMKISTRLYGAFALLIALLLVVAGGAVYKLSQLNGATVEIADDWLPSVRSVNEMDAQILKLRMTIMDHVQSTDDAAIAAIDKQVEADRAKLAKMRTDYEKLISSDQERKAYELFAEQRKSVLEVDDRVLALSRKHENDQARALLNGESRKFFDASMATLDDLVRINSEGADASRAMAMSTYSNARMALLALSAIAIALAVFAALLLVRSITRPLAQAVQLAEHVAGGDLSTTIQVTSTDETGQLGVSSFSVQ